MIATTAITRTAMTASEFRKTLCDNLRLRLRSGNMNIAVSLALSRRVEQIVMTLLLVFAWLMALPPLLSLAIFTDQETITVFNDKLFVRGTDIQTIFDQLGLYTALISRQH